MTLDQKKFFDFVRAQHNIQIRSPAMLELEKQVLRDALCEFIQARNCLVDPCEEDAAYVASYVQRRYGTQTDEFRARKAQQVLVRIEEARRQLKRLP